MWAGELWGLPHRGLPMAGHSWSRRKLTNKCFVKKKRNNGEMFKLYNNFSIYMQDQTLPAVNKQK